MGETTVLFADDAAFVLTARTLEGLLAKIRNIFSDIAGYLDVNRLVPNATKSKLMIFTSRPTPNLSVVLFASREIEWVTEFKYLRLTIINNLSFSSHINRAALNLSRITGSFINSRSFLPIPILIKLYYALAYPHIQKSYCCMGRCYGISAKKFDSMNKQHAKNHTRVTRVNGRPTVSNNELYKQLGLLKLTSVFKYNLFKFLILLLSGELPAFWTILLSIHIPPHSYNTRQLRFRHPTLTCEIERRALSHQLILLYESVPRNILEMNLGASLKIFKRSLMDSQ